MNYPEYTHIYQICLLPTSDEKLSEQMRDCCNNMYHGIMYRTALSNNTEWENTMNCYVSRCKTKQQIPILHLDMHGFEHGFGKDLNDYIDWNNLICKITELNRACDGKLFLSLNVCKGLLIYNNLLNNDYPLAFRTIGSYEDIIANEGKQRFLAMYEEYLNSKDMNKSILAFFNYPKLRSDGGCFELV